ncbi:MAG: DNA double-strand break repair nuclease NurA [Candidatus Diapherotrites archaeon]
MALLNSVINDAVELISSKESTKKQLVELLLPLKKELVKPVNEINVSSRIGGVDSGFVAKKLSFIDLVLIRTSGIVFNYENSILKNAEYLPCFFEFPSPHLVNNALEDDELNISKSLMRLKEEVGMAKQLIEKKCKYVFLDGSIVPQYQDQPRKDSKINALYNSIIDEFTSMYELAEKNNCSLIAFIEDSRGSRFAQLLKENHSSELKGKENLLEGLLDPSFLDLYLLKGERTIPFTYTKNISQHAILKDFPNKWSEKVHALYLKPTEFDRPLRIEFLSSENDLEKKADEFSSIAFALSSFHREYAYPAPLIEADLRARLKPEEIDTIYNKIQDKLSKSIKLKLRRNSRPF